MKYPDIEKRVRKLEAAARGPSGLGVHVAFVSPGEDRDEQVAKLGPIPPGDHLIVVNFVRPADMQSPSTLQ